MAQGQSAYKSHLPLLKSLERVPVTNWSADFNQAWALGKGAHPSSWNVPTPFTWNRLMACSPMQHKLPNLPLGLWDAQTHICALWMHDGSSLRPGLMAEPWYTTLLTGTGKAEPEQQRGSICVSMTKAPCMCWSWASPYIVLHRAEPVHSPALGRSGYQPGAAAPCEVLPSQQSPVMDSLCMHSVKPKKLTHPGLSLDYSRSSSNSSPHAPHRLQVHVVGYCSSADPWLRNL